MHRIEHAVTLIIAIVVSHLPARFKSADDKTRFRNSFFAVLVAMVLIFVGVARLPAGWSR